MIVYRFRMVPYERHYLIASKSMGFTWYRPGWDREGLASWEFETLGM